MFAKLRISNPVCPPPPVASFRIVQRVYTVDREKDGKCHAGADEEEDHHHPHITKEEISILRIRWNSE
jgi:hypothetical protein